MGQPGRVVEALTSQSGVTGGSLDRKLAEAGSAQSARGATL